MSAPTNLDLGAFLGRVVDAEQATAILGIVTSMCKSYVRGQGFSDGIPNDELAAVIVTAAARLLSNPRGLLMDEAKGPESVSYRSAFTGWTLPELFVLNRFRVTAL